jgi:hypothetical protein
MIRDDCHFRRVFQFIILKVQTLTVGFFCPRPQYGRRAYPGCGKKAYSASKAAESRPQGLKPALILLTLYQG